MPRIRHFVPALVLLVVACVPAFAGWKAGVAKVDITPTESVWMSGYASRNRPADEAFHALWAKALVVEDAKGRRGVLVTLDLVGVPRDLSVPVCAEITKKYRLERSQVVLATSHTHTGPVVGGNLESMYFLTKEQHAAIERYAKFLHAAIVRAVDEASAKLAPGTLAWAHGKATFAVNRRNNPEKKVPELRAANKLRGPIDHDAPVLRVRDAKGKDLAVVFGYACDPPVLWL